MPVPNAKLGMKQTEMMCENVQHGKMHEKHLNQPNVSRLELPPAAPDVTLRDEMNTRTP